MNTSPTNASRLTSVRVSSDQRNLRGRSRGGRACWSRRDHRAEAIAPRRMKTRIIRRARRRFVIRRRSTRVFHSNNFIRRGFGMSGVRYRLSRLGFPPRRAMPTARATNERDSEMASLTATLGAMGPPATRTRSRRIAARDAAARVPVPRSQKGDAIAPRLRKRQGGALAARASAGGNAPKAAAADVDDSQPAAFGGEFSGDRIKRLQTKTLAALFTSYLRCDDATRPSPWPPVAVLHLLPAASFDADALPRRLAPFAASTSCASPSPWSRLPCRTR